VELVAETVLAILMVRAAEAELVEYWLFLLRG
jgi:hypothetical protein